MTWDSVDTKTWNGEWSFNTAGCGCCSSGINIDITKEPQKAITELENYISEREGELAELRNELDVLKNRLSQ